jgi:hypothetical protein
MQRIMVKGYSLLTWLSLFFLITTAHAQIPPVGISDEGGTVSRPVFIADCVGDSFTCSHVGITATLQVDAVGNSLVNGTFKESFNALATSDGATITMTLEKVGQGDLTMQFSDGSTNLDCSPTLCSIELTAGSDASPTENFIYIPQSTKVLTKSTTDWPSEEHIRVSYFLVPSATFVQSNGTYINQNWNDHLAGTDNQGHIAHMGERLRYLKAIYHRRSI